MQFRMVLSLLAVSLAAGIWSNASTATLGPAPLSAEESSDVISGEWEGVFDIGGSSATLTFKLKLEGEKVTGTAESAHTGPGTISHGSLVDNKLNFTLDFAAHESVAVSGSLTDGTLSGEFRTEGMVGKWVARKKIAPVSHDGGSAGDAGMAETPALSLDLIAGEWNATFEAQGSTVPVTFKFNVEGDRVTGTSESAHLGPGKISKGSLADGNLSFTMEGPFGSIAVSGVLKEGKLVGEFDASKMHGKFAARKK